MNYKDLFDSIKNNNVKNIYLFYGEESYLVNSALEKMRISLVDPSLEQLNFIILDGREAGLSKIIDACETLPFMAERKLIYLKNMDILQGKSKSFSDSDEEYLVNYIKDLPSTATIVFIGGDTIDSRRKIIKEIKKYGDVIEFSKLSEEDLNKWIKKTFKSYGKSIGTKELIFMKNHLSYLNKNSDQTLLEVENEIKKIVAFMGEDIEVDEDRIEKILGVSFQNNIFKLLDSIEAKNASDSIKRLNLILDEGEHVLKILSTLGNQIKNILSTKLLLDEGYSSKVIATKLNIHPFVAGKCANQSKKFTVERLRVLLNKCLDTDRLIKLGKMNDKLALEMFVMEMSK